MQKVGVNFLSDLKVCSSEFKSEMENVSKDFVKLVKTNIDSLNEASDNKEKNNYS